MEESERKLKISEQMMNLKLAVNDHDCFELNEMKSLSPNSQGYVNNLISDLKTKKAFIGQDESGKIRVEYTNERKDDDNSRRNWKQRMSHVDITHANLIASPRSESDKLTRVEALVELVNLLKENKCPSGVNFDTSKICSKSGLYRDDKEFIRTKEVLGTGSTAGDIIVVKDCKTHDDHALKTVMISAFRNEELKMWVDLNDEDFVPSLLIVRLQDNKLHFHMEKLNSVVSLRDIIDEHMSKMDSKTVRPLSLSILHGLLTAVNKIHDTNWTHRDLHAGNVLLQKNKEELSLEIKIIDFGMGQLKNHPDGYTGLQNDLLMCFRLFSALYLGQEFDSIIDVKDNGFVKLEQLCEYYKLPEEDRKEILQLFSTFLDVIDINNKSFGDAGVLITHVENLLSSHGIDKSKVLQEAALILFPEKAKSHPSSVEKTDGGKDDNVDSGEKCYSTEPTGCISQDVIDDILPELVVG